MSCRTLAALCFLCPAVWCLAPSARGEALDDALAGRWTGEGSPDAVLQFYGAGVGKESGPSTARFFHVVWTGTNAITLSYGSGAHRVFEVACGEGQLDLVSGGETQTYARASGGLSGCETNLLRIEGAKAVWAADHPGQYHVAVSDLVPAYLGGLPESCDGCIYTFGLIGQPPVCSAHGIATEQEGSP